MVNRQARLTTTGCYKSTSALVADAASLRPATSFLDNGQRRFALRLVGLPSSGQTRCVVGAKDALGQQPSGHQLTMEATTLMTTGDHPFGEVTIEDTDAAATRVAGYGDLDGSRMAPSAAQSHGTTPSMSCGQECGSTWAEPGGLRR